MSSSARFNRLRKEFLSSPEASAPAPVVPYHDILPSAPPSTRELQERKDRLARPDTIEGTGREGMVPEGGSIAQVRSRDAQREGVPDVAASQLACFEALTKVGASAVEIKAVAEQLKDWPMAKLLDPATWTTMLTKLRKFRRGTLT